MMISKKMAKLLNEQLVNEYYAHITYLAMSFLFEEMNLKGYANWFFAQAQEEMGHAHKFARYMLDQGIKITIGSIPAPKTDYKKAVEIVQGAYDHEIMVTKQIHKIADLAVEEKDQATYQFISWFVTEQVEEVATTGEMLATVKMAETPGQLLMLQEHLKRGNVTAAN
jgi:ferritin